MTGSRRSIIHRIRERATRWWQGEFVPHEDGPGLIFLGGGVTRRHWTARALRAAGSYASENYRWLITTAIAVLVAIVGVLRH